MIAVKEAVLNAQGFLKELVPNAERIAVEEIELSDDERWWNITLSFFEGVPTPFSERKLKLFEVSAATGQIKAMKIRTMK